SFMKIEKGRSTRPNFQNTYLRRPEYNPAAVRSSTKTCGHMPAPVRHVTDAGGVRYVCRACFAYERAVEFRAVVRNQVAALFRNLWPRGITPGAVTPEVAYA